MNKRNAITVIFGLLLAMISLIIWLQERSITATNKKDGNQSHQPLEAPSIEPIVSASSAPSNPMQVLLRAPILFYGIVLDQHGQPVPAAKVSGSVVDNVMRGSSLSTTADPNGKFTIQSKGMSLTVEVASDGYERVERGGTLKPSSQGFDFGEDVGRGVHHPDPASPVVFQLRKPTNPARLEAFNVNPAVPRDGTPINVNLSNVSKSVMQISCYIMEDNLVPNAPYDWRCEVVVLGGGIQETKDESAVEAPADGYVPTIVIDMPKTLDVKKWSSEAEIGCWVRFPDNTFGKLNFRMISGGDHFAVIEGFRNPMPNDRNLERESTLR